MKNIKDLEIVENASLNKINTYKLPSTAKYLINVKSVESLIKLICNIVIKGDFLSPFLIIIKIIY